MLNLALGSLRPLRGAEDRLCAFKELDKAIVQDSQ